MGDEDAAMAQDSGAAEKVAEADPIGFMSYALIRTIA